MLNSTRCSIINPKHEEQFEEVDSSEDETELPLPLAPKENDSEENLNQRTTWTRCCIIIKLNHEPCSPNYIVGMIDILEYKISP